MKNVLYMMIVLIMSANFASCSIDPMDEEFPVEGTVGEDETNPDDDEDEDS